MSSALANPIIYGFFNQVNTLHIVKVICNVKLSGIQNSILPHLDLLYPLHQEAQTGNSGDNCSYEDLIFICHEIVNVVINIM